MAIDSSIPLAGQSPNFDFGGSFQKGFGGAEAMQRAPIEREKMQLENQQTKTGNEAKNLELASAKLAAVGGLLAGVKDQQSYLAHLNAGIEMGVIPPEFAQKYPNYDPVGIRSFTDNMAMQKSKLDEQLKQAQIQQMTAGGSTGVLLDRLQSEPGLMDTYLGKSNANKGLISTGGNIQVAPGYNQAVASTEGAKKAAEQEAILGNAGNIEAAKATGKITGEASGEKAKRAAGAENVITLLDEAEKILPMATNGLMSRGYRGAMNAFGQSTDASQADRQLAVLSAALTASVPKMSGPQSDRDVAMYKQAAGDVANEDVPYKDRLAAVKTIRGLQEKYKDAVKETIGEMPGSQADIQAASELGAAPAKPAASKSQALEELRKRGHKL